MRFTYIDPALRKKEQNNTAAPSGAATGYTRYFSPSFGQEDENYRRGLLAKDMELKKRKSYYQELNGAAADSRKALDLLQNQLQWLSQAGAGQDAIRETKDRYLAVYQQYLDQTFQLSRAKSAYESGINDYNMVQSNYQKYRQEQSQLYQQWRDSIRDPAQVEAELGYIAKQIEAQKAEESQAARVPYLVQQNQQAAPDRASGYLGGVQGVSVPVSSTKTSAEMQNLLDRQKLLREERDWGKHFQYAELPNAADFALKSQYQEMLSEDPRKKFADLDYAIINKQDDAWAQVAQAQAWGKVSDDEYDKYLSYGKLTQDEIAKYNYLYATRGKAAAQEYVDGIQEDLNRRRAVEMFERVKGKPGVELAFGVAAGFDQANAGLQNLFNTKDDYIAPSSMQLASGMVREDLKDTGPKVLGSSLGQAGYDLITTGANMAPSIMTSMLVGMVNPAAGSAVGSAMIGASAAGNAYAEKLNQGYDKDEARTYGILVGASEALLERFLGGISKLGGGTISKVVLKNMDKVDNIFARFAKSTGGKILMNAGSEAVEEGLQSVLEPFIWRAVSGEEAEVDWGEAMYSALLGFASGGMFEGVDTVIEHTGQKRQEKAAGATPKSFQEVVRQQVAEKMGGKTPIQPGAVELATPTVQFQQEQWDQSKRLAELTGRNIKLYEGAENKNGNFDPETGEIWLNTRGGDVFTQVFSHELTHSVELAGAYGKLSEIVLNRMQSTGIDLDTAREAKRQQYAKQGHTLKTAAEVDQELVADYVSRHLLTDEASITSLVQQDRSLGQRIKGWFDGLLAKLGNKNAQERVFLERARGLYEKALRQTQNEGTMRSEAKRAADMETTDGSQAAQSDTANNPEGLRQWAEDAYARGELTDEEYDKLMDEYDLYKEEQYTAGERKYSFKGYADDGKGIYESNFPKGTPKKAKGEKILRYIQDVWSKKPITLRIVDGGITRYIEAQFDPTYSDDKNVRTDASKLMGGNRHGNATEQRVTLDLADDYYQIASESEYNYSKDETGKDSDPHQGVKQWHYFVNDIYFAEYGSEELTPYRVSINVKERGDGHFFYNFSAEKTEGTPTQRTLHAAVNDSDGATANGSSSEISIYPKVGEVKKKFSMSDDAGVVDNGNGEIDNETVDRGSETVSKKDVARELRAILNRGGDAAELRRYVNQLEQPGGKTERKASAADRTRPEAEQKAASAEQSRGEAEQKASEAEKIVKAARKQGVAVEQYLRENAELYDVDGQWNNDARKALELEKQGRRKWSVSEGGESAEAHTAAAEEGSKADETKADVRSTMPKKAKAILDAAERALLADAAKALHVPSIVSDVYLAPIVKELADIYLDKGALTDEDIGLLFDKAYANGVVACKDYLDQNSQVAERLHGIALTPTKAEWDSIFNRKDFKEGAHGNIRIVSDGGMSVAEAFQIAQGLKPDLFPKDMDTARSKAWRLVYAVQNAVLASNRMEQIKSDSEAKFREKERADFNSAVSSILSKLWEVKRFVDDKTTKEKAPLPATAEEVNAAYQELEKARRALDRAKAKNLLTEQDEMQVGRLLRHEIELEHLNPEKDNVKGITVVFEAKQEYEQLTKLITEYKRHLRAQAKKTADSYLETANDWKDKRAGIAYSRETMERNIFDIIKDKALAQSIIDKYFTPVHKGEAAATRFKNDYRDRVRALGLSTKVAQGNLVSEAHAVQLLGEAEDNIRMLENTRGRIKNRDGKNLSEWKAAVEKLWQENPNLDKGKIEKAVKEFRYIYDALFQKMNQVRVANGYEPINYRNGYFPHFQPGDSDSILAQFGKALGIDTRIDALPTTINGLTHTFKPGIQWFGNAQERLGFNTAYDAVEGFDKYIEGAASVIFQTENIQNLRALASQIRYRTSDEGIREQVDAIHERPGLSEEEKQHLINEIYARGKFTLSNFVSELDEYTNLLANKKSRYDRAIEAAMGRRVYTFLKAWESRVAANMIGGNLTSALTNFIPLTQAGAQMDRFTLLQGMWQTLQSYRSDDGMAGQSTFLTNRRGSDPLVQTWAQKTSNVLSKPMEWIDGFVSGSIVRGAYAQNIKRGMSAAEAMDQADAFAASVIADRSKGAMPTLFHSTNPLMKAFTQFQLEVNNQFSEVFKDVPRRFKEKGLAALALVLLKYFLGAWIYNELYEKLVGRRPALDPIGMLCQFGEDWQEDGLGAAGAALATGALEQLPFSSGLTLIGVELDGGRIPASSAVMDLTALWKAATTEGWSAEKRWKEVQDELNKLAYVVPPFGGNQAGKIYKGVKAYIQGGSYSVDADGKDVLQYPVYRDDPQDAFWSLVKAAFLGKISLQEAQDWVDSGFQGLGAKQTAAYQDMLDAGVKDRDAYALIQQLRDAQETGDKKKAAVQRDLLRGSQVSGDGKAIAYYGLMASEKEQGLMDQLTDLGADAWSAASALMELADVRSHKGYKQIEELSAIAKAVLTDKEKAVLVGSVIGTELLTDENKPTQYAKFDYAVQNGMGVNDYIEYRKGGGNMDKYLQLRDGGLSVEDAMEVGLSLAELSDVEDVKAIQKWRVVIDSTDDPEKQLISLSVVMSASQYAKVLTADGFDVKPALYVKANELLTKYDADGNGSYTQAEVRKALTYLNATASQKAVLWQLITGSSSAKNNPYNASIGQRVIDALKKAKSERENTGLSFQEEIMRQIMGG